MTAARWHGGLWALEGECLVQSPALPLPVVVGTRFYLSFLICELGVAPALGSC